MTTLNRATKAIRQHPVIAYFALWLASSLVMYLLPKTLLSFFLKLSGVLGSLNTVYMVVGAITAGIIMATKNRKQGKPFNAKAFAVPFTIMMVSISSVLKVVCWVIWDYSINSTTQLIGAGTLGAAITGMIMLVAMLTKEKTVVEPLVYTEVDSLDPEAEKERELIHK